MIGKIVILSEVEGSRDFASGFRYAIPSNSLGMTAQ
jgi:hypothetical protein